jgi:beta-N-acetylhexosaminidase
MPAQVRAKLRHVLGERPRAWAVGLALIAVLAAGCGGSERAADATPAAAQPTPTATATPTASATPTATATPTPEPEVAPRPAIVRDPIPFGDKRRAEMAAYALRHYGTQKWQLTDPKVIVEHYTVTPSYAQTRDAFVPDQADPELGELPGVCSHFVIDRDGTIYQLVPLSTMCRHTVGLNWTAIGIEHVAATQAEALADPRQRRASLALTTWLRCRYGVAVRDVIGHAESLSSPYHRENVPALRSQTHADFPASAMRPYRAALRRRSC